MNTKPKLKRYTFTQSSFQAPPGGYANGLHDPVYASELAAIVSGFSHLEGVMAKVLAVLLGLDASGIETAGYVLRALRSPSSRIDIMKDLLELSPRNKALPPGYDEVLCPTDYSFEQPAFDAVLLTLNASTVGAKATFESAAGWLVPSPARGSEAEPRVAAAWLHWLSLTRLTVRFGGHWHSSAAKPSHTENYAVSGR